MIHCKACSGQSVLKRLCQTGMILNQQQHHRIAGGEERKRAAPRSLSQPALAQCVSHSMSHEKSNIIDLAAGMSRFASSMLPWVKFKRTGPKAATLPHHSRRPAPLSPHLWRDKSSLWPGTPSGPADRIAAGQDLIDQRGRTLVLCAIVFRGGVHPMLNHPL